ncbi:hypothetical protein INS90_08060 [Trueperella pecoris]|uniref:Alpha/beta hydrolase family protein n=1 Tax=Trueperella pecoris TaxID=2733571 RepID=A0A7M1R0G8_9ACTO|nr:hypothetical protein [Trueperella pecoris]QOR47214.1 hypothetical protein INS90_08060 [Trueperella pecoris]
MRPRNHTPRLLDRAADYVWYARNFAASHLTGARPSTPRGPVRATIVVLPGVLEDPGYFHKVFGPLEDAGYDVVTLNLGHMTKPVPDLARLVLDDLSKRADASTPIVLLSHSKGSLVGRAVLAALPRNVHGLVAIAAPWNGSTLARLFTGWSAIDSMVPGGAATWTPWPGEREQVIRQRIFSLTPTWDPHIPEGSELEGATNIPMTLSGHFRGIGDPATLDLIVECVKRLLALPPLRR